MKKDGDGRKLSHEVLEQYRLRAVELRRDGKKVKEIAYFFGVHPGSVSRWLTIHRREGRKALKSRKAKGPEPKLTQREMKQILSWLKDDAMAYGFETPLWNCKCIQQMITEKIGKRLHTTSIMRWLKRWNFTNQNHNAEHLSVMKKLSKDGYGKNGRKFRLIVDGGKLCFTFKMNAVFPLLRCWEKHGHLKEKLLLSK